MPVQPLSMNEGRTLQKITRSATNPVRLRGDGSISPPPQLLLGCGLAAAPCAAGPADSA
jgi:hypothetical protein